jgi:N-acyl-D-aspartate/D-glutamate deacylase
VIDGSGRPGRSLDVAVENGRISEVAAGLVGDDYIDADGRVVAPGFIDIHTHYDAQVFWDPALTPSCFHGVTTVVAGNCGFSIAPTRPEHRELIARTLENVEDMDVTALADGVPWDFETFPEYLASVERHGVGLNYLAYIGHTAMRLFVMGDAAYERPATAHERTQMAAVLREALQAGAAGFASSFAPTHRGVDGKPVPSRFSDRAELDELFRVVASEGSGIIAVAPGDVSIDELYERQPALGVRMTYGALLTFSNGAHRRLLELATRSDADIWPQVTPRPLAFVISLANPFSLNQNPVFAELMSGPPEARRAAYANQDFRRRALQAWEQADVFAAPRWESYEIAESTAHPETVGKRLTALGADPFAIMLDLALDEPDLGLRVRAIMANDDIEMVTEAITHPRCVLGLSDAGAHVGQICDAVLPTDLLGSWVRERKVMPLETAIRKLTSAQASLLGLSDRGMVRKGAWADLVVFDAQTVAPGPTRRVHDFPGNTDRLTADQPTGISHVLVNGVPIIKDGVHDADARPGQLVRTVARS